MRTVLNPLSLLLTLALACGDDDSPADAPADVSVDTAPSDASSDTSDSSVDAGPGECGDGIDNDGDGYVDWQFDQGCYGPGDRTEAALPRDQEDGWTTFDLPSESVVIYVSNEGDDSNDGLSPDAPVATVAHAASLVRDGEHDFILLRRGDTFRDENLRRFKSGRDADHPMVIASYGASMDRPRIENSGEHFIDHNGRTRNHLTLVGLFFTDYSLDVDGPDYDGAGTGLLRYVGGGDALLIEGCYFRHSQIVVQSFESELYSNVELRRNIMERAFSAGSCVEGNPNGNHEIRPQGIFTGGVQNLLFEENVFDHNGWSPNLEPAACATIYNHNIYLSNTNGLTIRNNLIARASSMGIKLIAAMTPGSTSDVLIEGNFITEGEIGISIGGNAEGPYRFLNSTIRGNVFSDIGRTLPTTRGLAWILDIISNDQTLVEDNLFLNNRSPEFGNMYGIRLGGGGTRGVTVSNNVFFRLKSRAIDVTGSSESITFDQNEFVDPEFSSCLIHARSGLDGFTFTSNEYFSSAEADAWFCTGEGSRRTGFSDWVTLSGETGSALSAVPYSDPERSLESYAATLGIEATLDAFLEEAREQSRMNWRNEYGATALVDHVREGFDR